MAAARETGLNIETPNRIVVDAGALYVNYGEGNQALLGATRGGGAFRITQEFRDVEVDGVLGSIKGLRRVVQASASITCTLIEFTDENLQRLIPGASIADLANHKSLTRQAAIADSDYLTNLALVANVSNQNNNFIGIIRNVLQTGEFAMTVTDREEGVVACEFTAHFDGSTPTLEPWELRWPTS